MRGARHGYDAATSPPGVDHVCRKPSVGVRMKANAADLLQRLPGPRSERWPDGERFVTAFAFYLAVMLSIAPLPALLRRRGSYGASHWLGLLLAALYAGNGIYVGRGQTVLILALGGTAMGLLVGIAAARRQVAVPQA